jgi:primosomal protein N' (replication factor Y)
MVVHRADAIASRMEFVRCHHCGMEQRLPRRCPSCSRSTTVFGLGTQRVEEEVARLFPQLRSDQMARVDSDSMQGSGALHQLLDRFGRGEVRLLMGTQMIAKGLDFPGVRVVGVVSADTSLNLPDFRASERTFQLVAQVAGRCGRGQDPGRAIIQTFQPDAPAIQAAARADYEGFAAEELAARQSIGLPPARRMGRVVVRHAEERRALDDAAALAAALRTVPEAVGVDIRQPSPCPIARIADRWRVQIELLSDGPGGLQRLLAAARSRGVLRPGEQVAVDVDPVALL